MAEKLTAQRVEKITPPASGRIEIWDGHTRGLGLRVTDKGVKSWTVIFRFNGLSRRMTLGKYPTVKLADARELADEALRKVARGVDPAAEKIAARHAPRPQVETFDQVVDLFIQRYAKPRNRSWRETERILHRYAVKEWKRRPITGITRRDVIALLDPIADRAPYMANRVRAALRRLFAWALERDMVTENPVANVKPLGAETARDRILTDDEVVRLWEAWDKIGWPFGPAFKLLLVTGQRREEVGRMRWADLDLDAGLWTLPREQTKSDRLHVVELPPLAVEILQTVPRTGDYVFSVTGTTPISGYSKAKDRADKIAEVSDYRLHDLRRTAASGMARLGIAPHVVERILNHATGQISGVAAVYNRYGYGDEKRRALEAWAATIPPKKQEAADNVVALHG